MLKLTYSYKLYRLMDRGDAPLDRVGLAQWLAARLSKRPGSVWNCL